MKHITTDQVNAIIAEFYKLNAPVQNFEALRKMLNELPDCPPSGVKEGGEK